MEKNFTTDPLVTSLGCLSYTRDRNPKTDKLSYYLRYLRSLAMSQAALG